LLTRLWKSGYGGVVWRGDAWAETRNPKHDPSALLRTRNPKWFDKLTILSRVEGQIQNANVRWFDRLTIDIQIVK
jgi:hypothetical protein